MRKFYKSGVNSISRVLAENFRPDCRVYQEGVPGQVRSVLGNASGACLHCKDLPCVFFNDADVASPDLVQFPYNRSREVCPVGALSGDSSLQIPVISESLCIGCGLCVSRCPANAMFINSRGFAVLSDADSPAFKVASTYDETSHLNTIQALERSPKSGTIRDLSFEAVEDVLSRVANAKLSNTNQKLLARNLLICLGARAAISSVGDTNLRIDMWWDASGILYVTEVDFDLVSLIDSPRNLLDDVAVCVSRHGVEREAITAAVINVEFPNKRSDYYHLVEDIQLVAGVTIITLPLAALLVSLWSFKRIEEVSLSDCIVTKDSESSAGCVSAFVSDRQLLNSRFFRATK